MMISNVSPSSSSFTLPSANRQRDNGLSPVSPAPAGAGQGATSPAFTLGGSLGGRSSSLGNELISVMNHPTSGDVWGSGNGSRSHEATMASFWASERVGMARNSGMLNMLESFGGLSVSGTYYGGSELTGAQVEDKMGDIKEEDVWDASEETLDELAADIERRAEAALNPVDENGNPISAEDLAASEAAANAGQEAPRDMRDAAAPATTEKPRKVVSESAAPVVESGRAFRIYSSNQQASSAAPQTASVDVRT